MVVLVLVSGSPAVLAGGAMVFAGTRFFLPCVFHGFARFFASFLWLVDAAAIWASHESRCFLQRGVLGPPKVLH